MKRETVYQNWVNLFSKTKKNQMSWVERETDADLDINLFFLAVVLTSACSRGSVFTAS